MSTSRPPWKAFSLKLTNGAMDGVTAVLMEETIESILGAEWGLSFMPKSPGVSAWISLVFDR